MVPLTGCLLLVSVLAFVAADIHEVQLSECVSSLTQAKCAEQEQFIEIDRSRNACPRCRGGLGFKTKCETDDSDRGCAPGLLCQNSQCVLDRSTCAFSHHLRPHLLNVPVCEVDGTFAAKQCKGDMMYGRCFCSDEQGNRIYGFSWRKDAERMTCACSRLRSSLESSGLSDATTFHCAPNGNFEPLQCVGGMCWCVDELTGRANASLRSVPQAMWQLLPCYSAEAMGDQYGRQCESVRMAQFEIERVMRSRGTECSFNRSNCNYAGSFGPLNATENGFSTCVSPDGKPIGNFGVPASSLSTQNCHCAQDRLLFRTVGTVLSLACAADGNYDTVQLINSRTICVDADGYAVSGLMNSTTDKVLGDCRGLLYEWVRDAEVK